MTQRIHKDDTVKIIAGANKGTTGKVLAVLPQQNAALVEGVGVKTRHIKPSQLNPRGGKKDVHVPVDLSKLALVVFTFAGTDTHDDFLEARNLVHIVEIQFGL